MRKICLFFACLVGALHGEENFDTQAQKMVERTLNYAKGHQEFRDVYFKLHEKEFVRLVKEGQSPKALFIGCSDSRVVPSLITQTKPGDLFEIRNAGNFVPEYSLTIPYDGIAASIQYGVEVLGIQDIIVCGHSHCGAIKGLFQKLDASKLGLVKNWLRFGEDAKNLVLKNCSDYEKDHEECYRAAEEISIVYQLEHLLSYPFVKKRVEEGTLFLHGWYFLIEKGEIYFYDPSSYSFQILMKEG